MYQLLNDGRVQRISDSARIPNDPGNRDWLAYQAWLAQGNTPPPVPAAASDVDAFREARLTAGFADPVTGKSYPCDHDGQRFLTATGSAAGFARGGPAKTFPLIAADGSIVQLNPADTFSLINDRIMPWVVATILYAKSLRDQIKAGNPPADITVGWP